MQLKNNHKGMTLIELLVTVAVLAILAIIVGFSMSKVSGNQAKTFADELSSLITQCRVSALTGANGKIKFNAEDVQYVEIQKDGTTEKEKTVKTLKKRGVTVTKATTSGGNPEEITFSGTTGAAETGIDPPIRIDGGGQTYQINIVKATGHHTVTRQ